MPAPIHRIYNSAMPTTGPMTARATAAVAGTVRTMLQVQPGAACRVIGWGYSGDAVAASNTTLELIETDAIPATALTAHVAANIVKYNCPGGDAALLTYGTGATGFYQTGTAPTEGTITTTRPFDQHWENGLYFQNYYPLGREPEVLKDKFLRIRATPGGAVLVNLLVYVDLEF